MGKVSDKIVLEEILYEIQKELKQLPIKKLTLEGRRIFILGKLKEIEIEV